VPRRALDVEEVLVCLPQDRRLRTCVRGAMRRTRVTVICSKQRQNMDEIVMGLVGLGAHAQSTAIGLAGTGHAAPRFDGAVRAKLAEPSEALGKLKSPDVAGESQQNNPNGKAGVVRFTLRPRSRPEKRRNEKLYRRRAILILWGQRR